MKNKIGNVLIVVIFLMVIMALVSMTLTRVLVYYQRSVMLNILTIKSYYLAYSGVNLAPRYFSQIPYVTIPKGQDNKAWIYEHLNSGKGFSQNMDGEIFLMRGSNNLIYSVGRVQNKYRKIFQAEYEIFQDQIKLKEVRLL